MHEERKGEGKGEEREEGREEEVNLVYSFEIGGLVLSRFAGGVVFPFTSSLPILTPLLFFFCPFFFPFFSFFSFYPPIPFPSIPISPIPTLPSRGYLISSRLIPSPAPCLDIMGDDRLIVLRSAIQ